MYTCLKVVEIGGCGGFQEPGVDDNGAIIWEPSDGAVAVGAVTKGMTLTRYNAGVGHEELRDNEIEVSIYPTDSRVAFLCKKYDRGGGWSGGGLIGLTVAVTANAVSKARAKKRSKGKVMVGHIRYEWLAKIGFMHKTFLLSNCVSLMYTDTDRVIWNLDLNLPKKINPETMANLIAQKSARYKLNMTDKKSDAALAIYTAYANRKQIPLIGKKETSWTESEFSNGAYFAPTGGEEFRPGGRGYMTGKEDRLVLKQEIEVEVICS
jgi:hypothetical protein